MKFKFLHYTLTTIILIFLGIFIEYKFDIIPHTSNKFSLISSVAGDQLNSTNTSNQSIKKTNIGVFNWIFHSSYPYLQSSERIKMEDVVSFKKINLVYSLVKKYHKDSNNISKDKLEQWLIRGVLYSLEDPYTEFFNEEQGKDFEKSMKGNFEGIGAALEKRKGKLVVTEVMKGFPAAKAGLLPGDIILKVDGKSVEDETIWESVLRIRGKKGTKVTLDIFRPGKDEKESFLSIIPIRNKIHVESVKFYWKGKNSDIAVFEISQFGDKMIEELEKNLKKISSKSIKGIIIDLRYNGGGYLTGAVDLASYFLPPKTKVVSIQGKNKEGKEDYFTEEKLFTQKFSDTKIPLLVLVNGGSASASEIFSGVISETKRGRLIGEKTFGKGSVQQIFPLEQNPKEFVKITIAKWMLPSGKNLTHDSPLIPQILVKWDRSKMTDEQIEKKYDPQMEKAIDVLDRE